MDAKIDLLLTAAQLIESRKNKGTIVDSPEVKKIEISASSSGRINKIKKLKIRREKISKIYIFRLKDIILELNKNIEFLKTNPLEIVYFDQLIEIGLMIRNVVSCDDLNYCSPREYPIFHRDSKTKNEERSKPYNNITTTKIL